MVYKTIHNDEPTKPPNARWAMSRRLPIVRSTKICRHIRIETKSIDSVMARGVRFLLGCRVYPFLGKTGPGVLVFGYCPIIFIPFHILEYYIVF